MPDTNQTAGNSLTIRYRAGEMFRRYHLAFTTLRLRTHLKRWEMISQAGPPTWDERNAIIARFIPAGSSVIDLGCGAQTLRQHLQPGCTYQPCDVVRSSPDLIFCDFNRGIYPKPGRTFDYVVCSGVLEYIRKPRLFLSRVADYGRTVILTYNPRADGESKVDRLAKHWVNHIRQQTLEKMFDDLGLAWRVANFRSPNEYVYLIKREKT